MSSAQTLGCDHVFGAKTHECVKCGVPEEETLDTPRRGPPVRRSFAHRLWLAKMAVASEQARVPARWVIAVSVTVAHGWWWIHSKTTALRWATSKWFCQSVLGQLCAERVVSLLCWALAHQAPEVRYDHAKEYSTRVRTSAYWGGTK